MTTVVNLSSESDSINSPETHTPRVAWLLQGAGAYWQPILGEFTRLISDTKVFSAEWTGFLPGFEASFRVEHVGPMKLLNLPGKSKGYGNVVAYLPPSVVKPLVAYRPDVVFTTGFSLWTMLVCALKLVFKWKVVIVYDGSSPGVDYRNSWVRSHQRRWLARLTDAFITNNKAGQQYIVEALGVLPEKVFARPYLLPHPKTYEAALKATQPLIDKPQQPVFVFAGNLIPRKGLLELLSACKLLVERGHQNFMLAVVGDGEQRRELETYVEENSLSGQVTWVGEVAYEKVGAYFNAADVFVFPTREDVWGLVLVEAMMFGKPVLASRWAGATEMVEDGVNGYVFDPYDPERAAELMAKFIERPELIASMGAESKRIMEDHRLEKVARSLAEVVDFCLR